MTAPPSNGANARPEFADETDVQLDALFTRARSFRPTPAQLAAMLRGVPRHAPTPARRYWRLGGATLALTAAVAAAFLLLLPHQPPALALARVAEAMRAVAVVQQTMSDGSVYWESPGRCSAVCPPAGGAYEYRDYQAETIATYRADRDCIILSSVDTPEQPYGRRGACTLAELIQMAEWWGSSFDETWHRTDWAENGRPIIRLESRLPGRWLRTARIDGLSGRILETETAEGTTRYAYPPDAPRDLYDLGVPRGVPVIDGTAPPPVRALRDQVRTRAGRGLGAYRLVAVNREETRRVISDGHRWRVETIRAPELPSAGRAELEARAQEFDHMAPLAGQARMVAILAGATETAVVLDPRGVVAERRVRPAALGLASSHTLEARIDWTCSPEAFFGTWGDEQCSALGPDSRGEVGYCIRGQGNRVSRPYCRERWYDPARGYALSHVRSYEDPHAEWQLPADWRGEYEAYTLGPFKPPADAPPAGEYWEVVEWAELRAGQWYPAVSCSGRLERAADGTWCRAPAADGSGVAYEVLLATPLDAVDDQWFEIPPAWLVVPAQP